MNDFDREVGELVRLISSKISKVEEESKKRRDWTYRHMTILRNNICGYLMRKDILNIEWGTGDNDVEQAPEKIFKEVLRIKENNKILRETLKDIMKYIDCDNLTMQSKYQTWKNILENTK